MRHRQILRKNILGTAVLCIGLSISALGGDPDPIRDPNLTTRSGFREFYHQSITSGMLGNFYYYNEKDPRDISNHPKTEAELLAVVENSPQSLVGDPWKFSQYPHPRLRLHGYDELFVTWYGDDSEIGTQLTNKEGRKAYILNSTPPSWDGPLESLETFPKPSGEYYKNSSGNSALAESKAAKMAACARLDLLNFVDCKKALEDILEFMSPQPPLSAIPFLDRIIHDASYVAGVAVAASRLMDRVETVRNGGKLAEDADLFQDLLEGYRSAGDSLEVATQKTWDILAVYSTRGANIHALFPYADTHASRRLLIALEIIAGAIPVLDQQLSGRGILYSLPKSVSATASYGKIYHFWMSAYLTRMGIENGHGAGSASAAALSEMAYQMLSPTAGRENLFDRTLAEKKPGSITRKIQIDLGFGLAGSEYGRVSSRLSSEPTSRIDIDFAIKRMVEGGLPQGWANLEKKVGKFFKPANYLAWLDQIHPITGLNAIRGRFCLGLFKCHRSEASLIESLPE